MGRKRDIYILQEEWCKKFDILVNYVDVHNKLPNYYYVDKDGFRLGCWVSLQRKNYKKHKLDLNRTNMLDSVKLWIWDINFERWNKTYNEVREYVEENNRLPIKTTISKTGRRLGKWVAHQRENYKNNILQQYQISMLEELKHWIWDTLSDQWHRMYNELCSYIKEYNKLPAFRHVTASGLKLGSWMGNQRTDYKQNILDANKISLLESLTYWGWSSLKEKWNNCYIELSQYIKEHSQLPIASYITEHGLRLGLWVFRQRQAYRKNRLELDKIKLLESLTYWSWKGR